MVVFIASAASYLVSSRLSPEYISRFDISSPSESNKNSLIILVSFL